MSVLLLLADHTILEHHLNYSYTGGRTKEKGNSVSEENRSFFLLKPERIKRTLKTCEQGHVLDLGAR